jgi:GGDEF domain-containing protein
MSSFNSSRPSPGLGLFLGFSLLNLLLLGAWVGFGRAEVPFIGVIATLCVSLAAEGLIWLRVVSGHDSEADDAARRERVAALVGRPRAERHQSIRDESTHLYHRWYLESRLEQEAARCERYGHSMAVLVLKAGIVGLSDMSVDTWQQRSLDAAQKCIQVVRNIDLSASLGPMEFAICLVQCDREGAERALARLVAKLTDYECHAGIAVFPEDGCEYGAMIELARVRMGPVEAAA